MLSWISRNATVSHQAGQGSGHVTNTEHGRASVIPHSSMLLTEGTAFGPDHRRCP
jgi:hypothetical protein